MQRFKTADTACPVCGGWDGQKRGQGERCFGFRSTDLKYIHCTSDVFAGSIEFNSSSNSYAHIASGPCDCGETHRETAGARTIEQPTASVAYPRVRDPEDTPRRASSKAALGEPVAQYDYLNADGSFAYQVVRYEPKTFRQRRRSATGMWINDLAGVEPLLFHLPELVAGVSAGDTVWIAEGEKDVLALEAAGMVATCNSGGAGKFKDSMIPYFRDADVVIVMDLDENQKNGKNPGLDHARDVYKKLEDVARTIRVVHAAEGKDAADHLAAGLGLADFIRCDHMVIPPEDSAFEFDAMSIDFFLDTEPEPIEWLIENIIPAGCSGMLVAAGGTGKSHLIQQMGLSGSCAINFGPFAVENPFGVLYLSREDDRRELHRRFRSARQALWPGKMDEKWDQLLRQNLFMPQVRGLSKIVLGSPLIDRFKRLAEQYPQIKLVVLDPLSKFLPIDFGHTLNSQEGSGILHNFADEIVNATGWAVLIVHHVNKQAQRDGRQMDPWAATGSGMLVDNSRFVLQLAALDDTEKEGRLLDWSKNYIEMGLSKVNYAAKLPDTIVWRQAAGGAWVHEVCGKRCSIIEQRMLTLLAELGISTAKEWDTAAGLLEPKIGINPARSARNALIQAGRVTRIRHSAGGIKGTQDQFQVVE